MFRSKKDVDRHVKDIFIKLKSSEEVRLFFKKKIHIIKHYLNNLC